MIANLLHGSLKLIMKFRIKSIHSTLLQPPSGPVNSSIQLGEFHENF